MHSGGHAKGTGRFSYRHLLLGAAGTEDRFEVEPRDGGADPCVAEVGADGARRYGELSPTPLRSAAGSRIAAKSRLRGRRNLEIAGRLQEMMTKTFSAIFEDGVFRPVEPVDFPEHCQVRVEVRSVEPPNGGASRDEAHAILPIAQRVHARLAGTVLKTVPAIFSALDRAQRPTG